MFKLPVVNLSTGKSDGFIIYSRPTLLSLLHPELKNNFIVWDCKPFVDAEMPQAKIADILRRTHNGYQLDFCTGSRKDARVIAGRTVISDRYFKTSKRVSHASILTTQCTQGFLFDDVKMSVLDDTKADVISRYGLGDCHGKCSVAFAQRLDIDPDYPGRPYAHAIQFRTGTKFGFLAKGTLLVDERLDQEGIDLILPESSFKSSTIPELNTIHTVNSLAFGVVFYGDKGTCKLSQTVTGWFKSESAQKEILSNVQSRIDKLVETAQNPQELAQFLVDKRESDLDDDEVEGFEVLQKIIASDKYGQLLTHPDVVTWLSSMLRKRWLELAGGGFTRATTLIASPLSGLPDKVMISTSVKTGDYIFFRYPIRHHGDINKIFVVNPLTDSYLLSQFKDVSSSNLDSERLSLYSGNIWISPSYFALFGGDFDGDRIGLIPANKYPAIAKEVENFPTLPPTIKPPKNAINGTVAEIAAGSFSNEVGLVTWAITGLRILGLDSNLPTLANLGQQVQLAVDGYKTSCKPDMTFVEGQCDIVKKSFKGKQCWLKLYKDKGSFDPTKTDDEGQSVQTPYSSFNDTISQCWNLVVRHYQSVQLEQTSRSSFKFLLPNAPQAWVDRASIRIREYFTNAQQIISSTQPMSLERRDRFEALYQSFTDQYQNMAPDQRLLAASAFWQASCNNLYSNTSIVFRVYWREICQALSEVQCKEFRFVPLSPNPRPGDKVAIRVIRQYDAESRQQILLVRDTLNTVLGRVYTHNLSSTQSIPPIDYDLVIDYKPVQGKKDPARVTYCQAVVVQ